MFRAITTTLHAVTNIIVALSRTAEKTVQLVENEVEMLQEEQQQRLTSHRIELATLVQQHQIEHK